MCFIFNLRFHGFGYTDYLLYRIQFADQPIVKMVPCYGRLKDDQIDHVNYAPHRFDINDVDKLEQCLTPIGGAILGNNVSSMTFCFGQKKSKGDKNSDFFEDRPPFFYIRFFKMPQLCFYLEPVEIENVYHTPFGLF